MNEQPNQPVRYLPINEGDTQSVKIVARVLDENTFTARMGAEIESDEEILANGERVPANLARYLFSSISQRCITYVYQ